MRNFINFVEHIFAFENKKGGNFNIINKNSTNVNKI